MKIFSSFNSLPDECRGSVAAVGNFDGVHLGHQKVFELTKSVAGRLEAPTSAITFEPHPRQFFQPDSSPFRLTTSKTRAQEIEAQGIDLLFELEFDACLASLSPHDFIHSLLHQTLHIRHVVVGEDFRFGKGRAGDCYLLVKQGEACGIGVTQAELLGAGQTVYSSTAIRDAVSDGDVETAARLLGRWFNIIGSVESGAQRGRTIGFPTANLDLDHVIHPKHGIYAVTVAVLTGQHKGQYEGVASIGIKPTFGVHKPNIETYIFDFDGNLYGDEIEVSLVKYMRPELKFEKVEALVSQMRRDCEEARQILLQMNAHPS